MFTSYMTNTAAPSLRRLLAQQAASEDTADAFRQAAALLAEKLGTNEVMADEIRRFERMADEYDTDAADIMDTITSHYSYEQFTTEIARIVGCSPSSVRYPG